MRMSAFWAALALQFLLATHWELVQLSVADMSMPSALGMKEISAMQNLKYSLQVNDTAWPNGQDPCGLWRGVQCVNGHIDSILLTGLPRGSGNTQLETLQPLLQLPYLRFLNASQVAFPGVIPDWFGRLKNLEIVDLTTCALNGTLPPSFGMLTGLAKLSLAENYLTGVVPQVFGSYPNLTSLNLSYNSFVGSIPKLNAPLLTILDLSSNNFSGLIPSDVSMHPNLQCLNLANNLLNESVPAELGNMQLLNLLDLSNNLLQGSIPPELGELINLNVLALSRNRFSGSIPPEISQCRGLRTLLLNQNNLTGTLPDTLNSLQSFTMVDVSFNGLTGLYPAGLLTPSLQFLDISRNSFYGPLPQELTNLQNLHVLNVGNNYFNNTVPAGLMPTAIMRKNCLADMERQHSLRICVRFYAVLGVVFQGFNGNSSSGGGGESTPPPGAYSPSGQQVLMYQGDKNNHLVAILAGVFGGLGLILFVGVMVFCLHQCERRRRRSERAMESGRVSAVDEVSRWGQAFTYHQLQSATNKFSVANLITVGHSGDLYKGEISGGTSVAVKRIDLNTMKRELYLAELEVFDKASHTKLISLLGHCLDRDDEKFLVYKYAPNGDLASSLHKKGSPGRCEDVLQSLDWITRLKIAIGVAEGLAYLHSECSPPIVHRDVKASSILLDDKYDVRIGSLSDARMQDGDSHPNILTRMFGFSHSSYDQADPSTALVSCTYDVYCFGKVLLELVSGKLGISGSTDHQWLDWALPLINVHDKDSMPKIVDPSLIVDEDLLEEVWAMAIIAKACLNAKPAKRPSMKHILKALENPHKVVREENFGESLAVRTSSHSSWNEALFGSWRHHNNLQAGGIRDDYPGMLPISRAAGAPSSSASNSREVYHLHHARRGSSDIVPEPIEEVLYENDE